MFNLPFVEAVFQRYATRPFTLDAHQTVHCMPS
jgi:hypothetical protein